MVFLSHLNLFDVVYDSCLDVSGRKGVHHIQNSCILFVYELWKQDSVFYLIKHSGWFREDDLQSTESAWFSSAVLDLYLLICPVESDTEYMTIL